MKYSAASVCLLFLVGQSVSGDVVSDSFNGTTLNTALWAPLSIATTGTVVQANNRLEVNGQATYRDYEIGVRLRGSVIGNFDAQVSFLMLTDIHTLDPGAGAGLAWGPLGAYFVSRMNLNPGGGAMFYSLGDGEGTVPYASPKGTLRVTRTGGTFSAYYWADGSWTLIHSATTSVTGPVDVYFGLGADHDRSFAAAFDDFYLQADGIIWETPAGPALALPHLAAGGPWTTELIVSNMGDQSSDVTIRFHGDDGRDLALPVTGAGNVTSVSATIPAHGTAYYEATDSTGPVQGGWGTITASAPVSVQAVFRNRASSGIHYEAAVPSNSGGRSFVMPFDATTFAPTSQPLYTGFALANLDTENAAAITCTARDATGTTIPGGISIPDIAPKGHYANYLFPNLTGRRGTLECTSNTMITALGLRVIGTDAFSSLSVQWK